MVMVMVMVMVMMIVMDLWDTVKVCAAVYLLIPHLRQHTTPPFSFAKTDFTQSSWTSRENFCFDFQLNDLQSPRS